jgi:hypothetical protein
MVLKKLKEYIFYMVERKRMNLSNESQTNPVSLSRFTDTLTRLNHTLNGIKQIMHGQRQNS